MPLTQLSRVPRALISPSRCSASIEPVPVLFSIVIAAVAYMRVFSRAPAFTPRNLENARVRHSTDLRNEIEIVISLDT